MVEVLTGSGDNSEIYFRLLIIEIIWKGIYFRDWRFLIVC